MSEENKVGNIIQESGKPASQHTERPPILEKAAERSRASFSEICEKYSESLGFFLNQETKICP